MIVEHDFPLGRKTRTSQHDFSTILERCLLLRNMEELRDKRSCKPAPLRTCYSGVSECRGTLLGPRQKGDPPMWAVF